MTDVVYGSADRGPAHGPAGPPIARHAAYGPIPGPGSHVEGSMQTRDGHQKGPQEHAEGQHGERTRSRFLEQIRHPLYSDDDEPSERDGASEIGRGDR